MSMNRRTMLSYSVATAALALTGCKKKKKVYTVVQVKNDAGVIVESFDATVGGIDLPQDDPVAVGATVSSPKLKISGKKSGQLADLVLNELFIGGTDVTGSVTGATGLQVVAGQTNLFTLTANGTTPETYTLVRTSP